MNAVEIEEAVSALASEPFDAAEFPFRFLQAFGNKDTTIKRLRARSGNASDVSGGVLQRSNIHLAAAAPGEVGETLRRLRESPKTASAKAKFVLATDGITLEAEELATGEVIASEFPRLGDHFGFFLPLAGISTVRQIKNNPIDVKATGRLNRLYVELLKDNPDWGAAERRHDLNQFMARLIFCFFAEDTGIFLGDSLFTDTIRQMSDAAAGNTHQVISELFRAMDTSIKDRPTAGLRPWADTFPYVNGNLFAGARECPRFSRIARSYLLRAGELSWRDINPDIFGSMIQAVADDGERGALGMHYTSVPNILKVLNPLFLDDLRAALKAAGDSPRKLRGLRRRLGAIRVFDPACGSGNFLVIAYKEMRAIEAEIVQRTGDDSKSAIPLANFYGIEIKDFAAEIARLALLIAEFQCDVRFIDQATARSLVLPLKRTGQIRTGNALRMDWLEICPPATRAVVVEHDLAGPTGRLALEENGLGDAAEPETYICGNPPYVGSRIQEPEHKDDLKQIVGLAIRKWKSLDYVSGWYLKATKYLDNVQSAFAFVSTSSMCEGLQASVLWPQILGSRNEIFFAHKSFKWANLAAKNAGVTVVVVGIARADMRPEKYIFNDNQAIRADNINAYLLRAPNVFVDSRSKPISAVDDMLMGAMPRDGGHLILSREEAHALISQWPSTSQFVKRYVGSEELINGGERRCLWIEDEYESEARSSPPIAQRIELVANFRARSPLESTRQFASKPHRFVYVAGKGQKMTIAVAGVSSERRPYLPVSMLSATDIASNLLFAIYDAPIWQLAIIASRVHLVWVATVCGKLETRYRYSNTLGWNTFPVPPLTENQKADLTRCADDILLAREAHFPKTIGDLYQPDAMPDDLRRAHDANDETLERIYIGRRFRNDTERLEKLFDMYVKMTEGQAPATKAKKGKTARKAAP